MIHKMRRFVLLVPRLNGCISRFRNFIFLALVQRYHQKRPLCANNVKAKDKPIDNINILHSVKV